MVFRYKYQGGVWIDLEKPTEDEIHEIAKEFAISERIEKEMASPSPMPLVIEEETNTFLELHFPTQSAEGGATENQEIDFIVGSNFIITVRYEVITSIHHLKKLFETRDIVSGHESITTDVLLEILFAHLYAAIHDQMNHLSNSLEHIERDMFNDRERTTVRRISGISRAFLHLEASLANQEEPLDHFLRARSLRSFFSVSFEERASRIFAERAQAMRLVRTYRAVATELRETNIALLESRQNEIMKKLAVLTVIAELLVVAFSALLIFFSL